VQPLNFVVREGFLGVGWGQGIGRGEKGDWGANGEVFGVCIVVWYGTGSGFGGFGGWIAVGIHPSWCQYQCLYGVRM
jgi:hypothetical protein